MREHNEGPHEKQTRKSNKIYAVVSAWSVPLLYINLKDVREAVKLFNVNKQRLGRLQLRKRLRDVDWDRNFRVV